MPNAVPVTAGLNQYPSAPQLTAVDRLFKGLTDPLMADAQNVSKLPLAQGAQNLIARGYADLMAPGLDTSNIAVPSMDNIVANEEKDYQARRQAAGQSGFDAYRMLGSVPASMALTRMIPMDLPGASAVANVLTQPVAGGDFTAEKAKQALYGFAKGTALGQVKGLLSE
jgi:hypothetical protein